MSERVLGAGVDGALGKLRTEIARAVEVEGLDDPKLGNVDIFCEKEGDKDSSQQCFLLKYDRGAYRESVAAALDL